MVHVIICRDQTILFGVQKHILFNGFTTFLHKMINTNEDVTILMIRITSLEMATTNRV